MFRINDDLSIYATRGDAGIFALAAKKNGEANHQFAKNDMVRFKVFEKKGCHCVVLQKDFIVSEATYNVDMLLTKEDTKIGEIISKPKDYWYEVELNPETAQPHTLVGYDENGAKVFRLFPEGADANAQEG